MWVTRLFSCLVVLVLLPAAARSHCEIPCGIYGDAMRFTQLRENIKTIEKSMTMITQLSKDPGTNINQLVRWVNNKETHADAIRQIVTQYFLTQRIKPNQPNAKAYGERLAMLHQMIVAAMKCKQTTSKAHTASLSGLVDRFEKAYLGKQGMRHLDRHHGSKRVAHAASPQRAFEQFADALASGNGARLYALLASRDRAAFRKALAGLKAGLARGDRHAVAQLRRDEIDLEAFAKMGVTTWITRRLSRMPATARQQFVGSRLTDLRTTERVASGRIRTPGQQRTEAFWAVKEDGQWRVSKADPARN